MQAAWQQLRGYKPNVAVKAIERTLPKRSGAGHAFRGERSCGFHFELGSEKVSADGSACSKGRGGPKEVVIRSASLKASFAWGMEILTNVSGESRLKEWFREWRLPLRRFLLRSKLAQSAELDDIAQEVFLRLIRYDRAEVIDRPQAYLFKIAVNVSNEWAMRSSRQMPHDSAWLADLIDASSPEIETEKKASDDRLRKAVGTLPMRAQKALRLHFDEGMTRAEIAEALGVTRKIVKRDIERAYASLRFLLDPARTDVPYGRDEDLHE